MRRIQHLVLLLMMLVPSQGLVPLPARAQTTTPGACVSGSLPHGALSLFCIPIAGWNGDLIIFAHGYTAVTEPLGFQHLTTSDGVYLPDLLQHAGFAFATTSYRTNGLAVLEGIDDIQELIAAFPSVAGTQPRRTYLTGASEGALVAALLVERYPEVFSGALIGCGPIGNFRQQLEYQGDFRVLFDYFFPGIIPGSPIAIPQELIDNWNTTYVPRIARAMRANPTGLLQLLNTSKAPIDYFDSASVVTTTLGLLWYSAVGTNDVAGKLGGNPYGNRTRWYWGSKDDWKLNSRIARFDADPAALSAMDHYETSGSVTKPIVILHTTGDPFVPYWHVPLYSAKAHATSPALVTPMTLVRYGHCNVTALELLTAFGLLGVQISGSQLNAAHRLSRSTDCINNMEFRRTAVAWNSFIGLM